MANDSTTRTIEKVEARLKRDHEELIEDFRDFVDRLKVYRTQASRLVSTKAPAEKLERSFKTAIQEVLNDLDHVGEPEGDSIERDAIDDAPPS